MSSPKLVNQKRSSIPAESNAPVTNLKEAGVAIPVPSPLNSPESGWSWRMAVDQHELNRMASPMTAAVPDGCVHSNKSTQPLAMVPSYDPANTFSSVPVRKGLAEPTLFCRGISSGLCQFPAPCCHHILHRDLIDLDIQKSITSPHYAD